LRQRQGIGALALEFTAICCSRTGETLGATWAEIDRDEKLWIVPANRMKSGREHRVPLSAAAMTVLHKAEKISKPVDANALIFLSGQTGKRLSVNSLSSILGRMGYHDITVHGFRSSFRDWAGEESHFPNDVIELALAHQVGTETEKAYRRKDALQKRRLLAEAWAKYCAKPAVTDTRVLAFKR
jgi:integrase